MIGIVANISLIVMRLECLFVLSDAFEAELVGGTCFSCG